MFTYCPNCSSQAIEYDGLKKFQCPDCEWLFFNGITAAVIAVLEYKNKILFLIRAQEPQKGKIDLPGGFVDNNENAEEAIRREIYEELGIDVFNLTYLGSAPNLYHLNGIDYSVCDLIFKSKIDTIPHKIDKAEVKDIFFEETGNLKMEKLAFPSALKALKLYEES